MKIIISRETHGPLFIVMVLVLIINPLSHFIKNVFGFGNTYYVGYVCWLALIICSLVFEQNRITRNQIIVGVILLTTFGIGLVHGGVLFDEPFENGHIGFFVCVSYLFCVSSDCYTKINKDEVYSLCRIVVICGLIAALYAHVVQFNFAIDALRNFNVTYNSWLYRSFFGQRNIYAEYCFLGATAGLNNYVCSRKKRYALFILFMALQIYISNSRAAGIAFILMIGIEMIEDSRYRWISIAIIIILCLIVLHYLVSYSSSDFITERLRHNVNGVGETSTGIRVLMWKDLIQFSINEHGVLFGFGFGAVGDFLVSKFGLESAHNVYMDIFFTGGVIYLSFYLYLVINSFIIILRNKDLEFRHVFFAGFLAYSLHSLAESGMMLFASNFFSLTATLFFVVFPRLYTGNKENYIEQYN